MRITKFFTENMEGLRMAVGGDWDNGHLVRCRRRRQVSSLGHTHANANGRDVRCPSRAAHIMV